MNYINDNKNLPRNKENTIQIKDFFADFLDCHTNCFQTLLCTLQLNDKHIEITRVLLLLDSNEMQNMIQNLELYGKICSTCAKRALDVFGAIRVAKVITRKQQDTSHSIFQ
ncbi:MAG: hypothetical protein HYT83_02775 [Candidatus Levybacteria bacterium]|nr:hypothetical protein [Candidatus Levybacteria bacterium]